MKDIIEPTTYDEFMEVNNEEERLLVFELTDDEYEEYEKLSPCEIMNILEEYGFKNGSDYFVQPGDRYTDYEFVACVSHGFGGQLIIKEITSYNV